MFPEGTNRNIVDILKGRVRNTSKFSLTSEGSFEAGTYKLLSNNATLQTLPYPYLSIATNLTLSSSSDNDKVGSTGATAVLLQGLNENWDLTTEIINMNGQAPVLTTNKFIRVFVAQIFNVASNLSALGDYSSVGTIYVGSGDVASGVPTVKYLTIEIGASRNRSGIYSVARGYTAYIYGVCFEFQNAGVTAYAQWKLALRLFGVNATFFTNANNFVQSSIRNDFVFAAPEKSDIEMRAFNSQGTRVITGEISILLVKNS